MKREWAVQKNTPDGWKTMILWEGMAHESPAIYRTMPVAVKEKRYWQQVHPNRMFRVKKIKEGESG